MGEYYREQRNQLSRAIANSGTGSKQLKGFVDNRNSSTNLNSCVLQLYASMHVPYGNPITHKAIGLRKDKFAKTNGDNYESNIGYFLDGGDDHYFGNSSGHSEERMLVYKGKSGIVGNTLDNKRTIASYGDKISTKLYTELKPCHGSFPGFDCEDLLSRALTSDSEVYYSFLGNVRANIFPLFNSHFAKIASMSRPEIIAAISDEQVDNADVWYWAQQYNKDEETGELASTDTVSSDFMDLLRSGARE